MGHYDEDYAYDEEQNRKQEEMKLLRRKQKPEWIEWDKWRKAFLKTKLSDLNVQQYLVGLQKLNSEPK